MDQCRYCQGPIDQATGICRRCGQITPADQFEQSSPFSSQPAASHGHCPRCGEETIPGQHFCRKCGLSLPVPASVREGQLVALPVGSQEYQAGAMTNGAYSYKASPDAAPAWWESPTQPVLTIGSDTTTPARALHRRRIWFTSLLLMVAMMSTIGGYLIIHAQTQGATRDLSGGGLPGTSTTNAGPTATAAPLPPVGTGYWHTKGTQIVDEAGQPVRIAGINWFGFESTTFVAHGLGQRDYHDLMREIKSLGYNTIRIPFSDQLFFPSSVPNGISFNNGMNQDLQGLNGLQILDKIVAYAGQLGLRVILDHHGVDAGQQEDTWSAPDCSASCFEGDWQMLAQHYLGNTTVIGADLDNEPHGVACWACGDPSVDWQMEGQKVGNEILAINPHWLIFVEGVECYKGDCFWWGGNLEGVADAPVDLRVPNQVVYSPHDYPPDVFAMPYFYANNYPNNLAGIWDQHWGFIVKKGIAPLWLGEFGTTLATPIDQQWLATLVAYLGNGASGISWTYWCLNPDSGDTGGILQNDWTTVNQNKQDYLNPIEFPLPGSSGGTSGN